MQIGLSLKRICPLFKPPNPLSSYTNTELASSIVVDLFFEYILCTDCLLRGPVQFSMPIQSYVWSTSFTDTNTFFL